MKIFVACPAPRGSRKGNRVTALRWARLLKSLGHRVVVSQAYARTPCDLMIALHARRSYAAIKSYRTVYPKGPLVVVLTGTDLYRDIRTSRRAQESLEIADRLVVLQRCGREELPAIFRGKTRVIYQSAVPSRIRRQRSRRTFEVCVLGHLRHEKDPFRTALAVRLSPATSRVRVTHVGQALSPAADKRARWLARRDPRYRWLGEVPRRRAREILARSHLLVLSSRMEGGANVLSEALADGVPILASRISGSEGILGRRYPGFFPVGDTRALAGLLQRAAMHSGFYTRLKRWCIRLAPIVRPARERQALKELLAELCQRQSPV
jgi:putative glycosyltransferase (TIGR04348 family)